MKLHTLDLNSTLQDQKVLLFIKERPTVIPGYHGSSTVHHVRGHTIYQDEE